MSEQRYQAVLEPDQVPSESAIYPRVGSESQTCVRLTAVIRVLEVPVAHAY